MHALHLHLLRIQQELASRANASLAILSPSLTQHSACHLLATAPLPLSLSLAQLGLFDPLTSLEETWP